MEPDARGPTFATDPLEARTDRGGTEGTAGRHWDLSRWLGNRRCWGIEWMIRRDGTGGNGTERNGRARLLVFVVQRLAAAAATTTDTRPREQSSRHDTTWATISLGWFGLAWLDSARLCLILTTWGTCGFLSNLGRQCDDDLREKKEKHPLIWLDLTRPTPDSIYLSWNDFRYLNQRIVAWFGRIVGHRTGRNETGRDRDGTSR